MVSRHARSVLCERRQQACRCPISWVGRESAIRSSALPCGCSELCVQTSRKDGNRSAVGIVAGIVDELIVKAERGPLVEAVGIIGFENLLGAIVELAIADQNPKAACSEIRTSDG